MEKTTRNRFLNRQTICSALLLVVIFLLPWQTRWIFRELTLGGGVWEYGKLSIYVVEALLLFAAAWKGKHEPMAGSGRAIGFGMLLIGAAFISISLGVHPTVGFGALFHLGAAFALFYLLLDRSHKTEHLVLAFVLGLILPAALGWFQVLTGGSPSSTFLGLAVHQAAQLGQSVVETESGRILRAYGSLSHPNVFGGFLAVGVMCVAWLVHRFRFDVKRWWLMVPILVLSATVVITFSRSAWLALIVGFLVLLGLMFWYKKIPPREAIPLGSLALVAVLVTLLMFHSVVFTRFQPNTRLEAQSIRERSGEYTHVLDVVRQNPFTGVGIGAYTQALYDLDPGGESWGYQPIHNTFLLIFAETGLLGFLLFVRWFTAIDQVNWKVRSKANGMFGMALGSLILVLAFFDHYPWSSWSGLALMAFCFALMLRWSLEATK